MTISSVSVVIPFYNRCHFISRCLESIYAQTKKADEIIIVDDCSTVEEKAQLSKIINDQANNSIPIKVIWLPSNSGVSIARNIGVKNASGDLIAFIDSDDYWLPIKLQKQINYLAEHAECDVVHTGVNVFDSQGETASFTNKPEILTIPDLLKSSHVVPSSLVIRKKVFIEVNGFDPKVKFSEDYEFSMRLLIKHFQIHCINDPLTYLCRDGNKRLTQNIWKYFVWHIYFVYKYRHLYIEHEGWFAINKYTAKYIHATAKKIGGLGNLFTVLGLLIYPPMFLDLVCSRDTTETARNK